MVECADESLYTGITNDLEKRFEAHQSGVASRYTRSRLPIKLVYKEKLASRSEALKRELIIKHMSRADKVMLVDEAGT